MSKPERRTVAAPVRLPGDPATADEERTAKESTLATIRDEVDAQRVAHERQEQALAAEYKSKGVKLTLPGDITPEMRAKSHADTVELVRLEMAEMEQQNHVRPVVRVGLDDASLDLIKAEFAKHNKRIVLPHG
jgi:hypothetical protein